MNNLLKKFVALGFLSATAVLLSACGEGTTYLICNQSGQDADFNETTVKAGETFKAKDKTFGSDWPVDVTGQKPDGTESKASANDPDHYVWDGTSLQSKSEADVQAACPGATPPPKKKEEEKEKEAPKADYSKPAPTTQPVVQTGGSTADCQAGVIHETVCKVTKSAPPVALTVGQITLTAIHYTYPSSCPVQSQVSINGQDVCTDTVEECTAHVVWLKAQEEKKPGAPKCETAEL